MKGKTIRRAALAAALCLCSLSPATSADGAEPWLSEHFRDHPLAGKVYSVRERRFVAPAHLVADAVAADLLLLGETHDNADHHRLQARLVEAAGKAAGSVGDRPAVVFEMIPADRAAALAEHLEAHPDDAAGMGEAVGWEERGWPDWAIYRPIAEAALAAGLPLRAGDLDTDLRKRIGREGLDALAEEERARLALDRPLPDDLAENLKATLRTSHCGMLPEQAVAAIFQVQRARDAALADAMLAQKRAVLIAGRGHVRADYGVPWYLRTRAPQARILAVGFVEVAPGEESIGAYLAGEGEGEGAFDYLWFTPAGSVEDHCAGLKERFGKRDGAAR